ATQMTLNYALGNLGGRQKSWMSSGQATPLPQHFSPPAIKRKPGRPAKPRPGELQQSTPQSHPTPEAQRDYHTPSNSTSPQLANVLSHPTASRPLPSPTAVFPSPSPSEEAFVERTSTPTASYMSAIPYTDGAQETAPVRNDAVPARDMSPNIKVMEGVRQTASALKRPAEADRREAGKRSRMENTPQQMHPQPPPLRTDNPRRTSLQHPGQGQSASPVTTPTQFSPMLGPPQPFHGHSLPQGMQNQAQIQTQAGRTPPQHHPHLQMSNQRRASATLDWYTQQDCLNELNQFCSTAIISEDHPRDGRRLGVLRDAIERQDWAYLTIHQHYCLLTADPMAIPASLRNNPNLQSALQLMRETLDMNEHLSPAVLRFFANFPMPLALLGQLYPQRHGQEALMFFNFMQQSVNFDQLRATCERRNCPPLVQELVYDLGITSTVFQRIVFTASLRRLWSLWSVPNEQMRTQFESFAMNIFLENQADFQHREISRRSIQPMDFEGEREMERRQWGSQLKELCDGYKRALQPNGSFLQSQPPLATAPQAQQQTRPPPPQNHHVQQSSTMRPPAPASSSMPPHSAQAAIQRGRGRGRPRLYPTPPRPQSVPSNQQVAQHPVKTPFPSLLPARGVHQPQQRQPNPARFGLHQAHLRSPVLRAKSTDHVLYQYVKGFLKAPVRLVEAGHKVEKWTFNMTRDHFWRIPRDTPNGVGSPPTRVIDENSWLLRLRCVKWTSPQAPTDHTWATADTSWIPYSYLTFNNQNLQVRKKLHHGKDLPIDLSPFVKEGENTLEIAIMRQNKDENYRKYLLAIEILGVKSHTAIKDECQRSNRVDASTTIEFIKRKLSSASDDDEIAIVESNLTINLFDPFSASKMCDIPVRGKACLHYDCFDLDTFLHTRERKGDVSAADQWKCPICNNDARPQHLNVDGFLDHVRAELYERGLQDTRAIIVAQDGSWKPKAE
ncbi:hypothetical protein K458DRAFT_254796, partial [Lentithecium fluviatile CBS 122367]